MIKLRTLNSVFPTPLTNGIITALSQYGYTWLEQTNVSDYNLEYHSNHSGNKIVSPLIDTLLQDSDQLTQEQINQLASILNAKYKIRWEKLYQTTIQEYNIIHNYDQTETETIKDNNTDTHNLTDTTDNTQTNTGTNTKTNTGIVTNNGTDSNNNSFYGFNSNDPVPTDQNSGQTSNTETTNLTDTDTLNTQVKDDGTVTHTGTIQSDKEIERELKRFGNIGITTSQQMLEEERKLWDWLLMDAVYSDIDKILTIPIY